MKIHIDVKDWLEAIVPNVTDSFACLIILFTIWYGRSLRIGRAIIVGGGTPWISVQMHPIEVNVGMVILQMIQERPPPFGLMGEVVATAENPGRGSGRLDGAQEA